MRWISLACCLLVAAGVFSSAGGERPYQLFERDVRGLYEQISQASESDEALDQLARLLEQYDPALLNGAVAAEAILYPVRRGDPNLIKYHNNVLRLSRQLLSQGRQVAALNNLAYLLTKKMTGKPSVAGNFAVEILESLVELRPERHVALRNLADAYLNIGELNKAVTACDLYHQTTKKACSRL